MNAFQFRVPNSPLTLFITRFPYQQVTVADVRAVYEYSQATIETAMMLRLPPLDDGAIFESNEHHSVNCQLKVFNRPVSQPDGSKQGLTWLDLHDLVIGVAQFLVPDTQRAPVSVDSVTFAIKHDEYGATGRGSLKRNHP